MQTGADAVKCVKMANSVEYVVAVGHASGLISVFQLPSAIPRANNSVMIFRLLLLRLHNCWQSVFPTDDCWI